MSLTKVQIVAAALVPLLVSGQFAGRACAQSMSTSAAAFETGYGLARNQLQNPIDVSTRDANGNRVLVDGEIMTGSDNSVYSYSKTLGAGDVFSGAGALGGATAVGNNLQVVVQGSYNTVIVHSTQTNNGTVTATANGTTATGSTGTTTTDSSLNGQVNLNGF
ncbi:MAG: holdfast anchoring protein HfaA [Asticcacaulis sp.]